MEPGQPLSPKDLEILLECKECFSCRATARDLNTSLIRLWEMHEEIKDRLVLEIETLKREAAVARERFGPAGYRIIQEVAELRNHNDRLISKVLEYKIMETGRPKTS